MNICLCEMTKPLARKYFRNFVLDSSLFTEGQPYQPYVYSQEKADAVVERYKKMGRVYLAVLLDNEPIGEIVLKNIDWECKHCTIGISLQCDQYKNKGYGTEAEILALHYVFNQMGLQTVYAGSLITNTRSQHVLKKAGFTEISQDHSFVYFRCDKACWKDPRIR